jgi:HK97 family phage prohead protease
MEVEKVDEQLFDNLETDCELKQVGTDDEGAFEGYASIFNNKDLGNDVIKYGAFANSIKNRNPKNIKLLYQHKTDEPIGVIEYIEEDKKGLKIEGRLAMGTQKGREVFELMKMGAIDSMSIGYRLNPDGYKYDPKTRKRSIKEVDLMEISLVTFPMNPKAKVTKVKLAEMTERELEKVLRDAHIFSNDLAVHTASLLHKSVHVDDQRDVADSIKALINTIKT